MRWRVLFGILAAVLMTWGAVQGIAGAREVAREQTIAGAIVNSSGCSAMVQTGYAGGSTFPVDTCRPLPAGTPVQVTLDEFDVVAVHLGSSEIYTSAGNGSLNQGDGFRTGMSGLALLVLVVLSASSRIRRGIRVVRARIL
jgi:hypothetical protein